MTTGTGLMLLGMWVAVAAAWMSKTTVGWVAIVMTIGVSVASFFAK